MHATSIFSIFICSPITTVWPRAGEGDSQVPSDAYLLSEANMSVELRHVNCRFGWEGRSSGLGTCMTMPFSELNQLIQQVTPTVLVPVM